MNVKVIWEQIWCESQHDWRLDKLHCWNSFHLAYISSDSRHELMRMAEEKPQFSILPAPSDRTDACRCANLYSSILWPQRQQTAKQRQQFYVLSYTIFSETRDRTLRYFGQSRMDWVLRCWIWDGVRARQQKLNTRAFVDLCSSLFCFRFSFGIYCFMTYSHC